MSAPLLRTKSLNLLLQDTQQEGRRLKRTLTAWDLTAIGIGCIIGVGIFVLPGQEAATHAGPAIIVSFAVAALAYPSGHPRGSPAKKPQNLPRATGWSTPGTGWNQLEPDVT